MYIIRVSITSGGETTTRPYESEKEPFKEALREVMGKILAGMSSVPEKIQMIPDTIPNSEAYKKFRSCTSKKQYVIKEQAEHDAIELTRKYKQEKQVYACVYCRCFHVGESMYSNRKYARDK